MRKSWVSWIVITFVVVLCIDRIQNVTADFDVDDFDVFEENEVPNFIQLYKTGVEAYLANDFHACVDLLEKALQNFRLYYETVTSCRIHCEFDALQAPPFEKENLDDLHFYEKTIRIALCLRKCKRKHLPELPTYFSVAEWAKEVFLRRKPYEYLHLCYNKVSLYEYCSNI